MPLPLLGMGIMAATTAAQHYLNKNENQTNSDRQLNANKEMADYNVKAQYDLWQKTGYTAQRKQMEDAGLNPALMYGMGGGGGQTAGNPGGSGVSQGQTSQANLTGQATQLGLLDAQTKNIQAQTEAATAEAEKTKAEAERIKGIDTEKATQETRAQKFANDLNDTIGVKSMVDKYISEKDIKGIEAEKLGHDYNAWSAGAFGNKPSDDLNTPIAKAYKAGFDKVQQDLQNAKTENDVQKAEAIIKQYQAELAKDGIAPDSDAWTKTILTLLKKTGILEWIMKL